MKDLIVTAYFIYLPVIILLTLYVSYHLFKNSIVYMRDIFNGREDIAKATNTLFKMGFYLMNLGFGLFIMKISGNIISTQATVEALSLKIGGFSIYLGIMLLINMYFFFRGKRIARERRETAALYNQAQSLPAS